MRDLLHGTVYLIIFNPSVTLPVLNDSSKLFCFLHALIIELCNVSRTIVYSSVGRISEWGVKIEGVGCGEGVSPSQPEKFCIFCIKITRF